MNEKQNLVDEEKLIDFQAFIDILFRRKNIIIFSSSLLFSLLTINTLNTFFRKPVYMGSFSILIEDPIDTATVRSASIEERLAANNTTSELPTLIQYLKSQHVLSPVAKELGTSSGYLKNNLNIVLAGKTPYVARGILLVSLRGRDKIKTQIALERLGKRFIIAAKEQRQIRLRSGLEFLDSEYPVIDKRTKLLKTKIENFRKKHNILDPFLQAKNSEVEKNRLEFDIQILQLNNIKLNNIKKDILTERIEVDGFKQAFAELGINLTGFDQELLNEFKKLQRELAISKTKYKKDSMLVKNLSQRIDNLYPEIKKQQIESIDLALDSNEMQIDMNQSRLKDIKNDFQLKPALISEYEVIQRELNLSLENLNSLASAKENFQLQIAQKSLPWRIIEDPIVGAFPISPNIRNDSVRNLLLAFFVGIVFALIKELTERGFTSEKQLELMSNQFSIPMLGSVPYLKDIQNINLSTNINQDSNSEDNITANQFICSESFRNIATSIRFLNIKEKLTNKVVISSTKPSEGKTTITSLIATTFADLGNKVLLIDSDMRRPSIHKFFDVDNINGLSNLITDSTVKFEDVLLNSSVPNLDIITAGIIPPDPVYLLSSNRMKEICKSIDLLNYDYVVFDAPPSETLADAKVLAKYCDLSLFIVTLNKVQKDSAKKVIKQFLDLSEGKTGIILNYLKENYSFLNNYSYSYSYKYNYNSDIYKYYKKDSDNKLEESLNKEKVNINKKEIKKKIIKTFKKFNDWLNF